MKGILSQRNKILLLALLIIGIVLTVIVVQQQQQTRSDAAIDQTLHHINIHYPTNQMRTTDSQMNMSAQAVNSANQEVSDVAYTWGISSSGSIGNLTSNRNLATFQPLSNGTGDIWVTAVKGGRSATTSFRMTVGDSPFNAVNWSTAHASLQASDFYISVDGKRFYAKNADVKLTSSAPYPPNFDRTTLEMQWRENGAEMRLHLYFSLNRANNLWEIYEIRTYDGSFPGEWLYYDPTGSHFIGETFAVNEISINGSTKEPAAPKSGIIYFKDLKIKAFTTQPPTSGYYIYNAYPTVTIPSNASSSTSYGSIFYLFNNGGLITDFSNLSFSYSISNSAVATVSPETDCQSGLYSQPCPQSRIRIIPKTKGTATVSARVTNTSTSQVLATTNVLVEVVDPLVSPTPEPTTNSHSMSASVYLHGIGRGGDNANPTSLGNTNPIHKKITATISYHDNRDTLVTAINHEFTYDPDLGSYTGSFSTPTNLPNGTYSVKITTPKYLSKKAPGFYAVEPGASYILSNIKLVAGDAMQDNLLNILDYNMLLGCYEDLIPAINCDPQRKLMTDFNDDGAVNQADFNLFLREISVQSGD